MFSTPSKCFVLFVFLWVALLPTAGAQVTLPPGFETLKKAEYKKLVKPELTEGQFVEFAKTEYLRLAELKNDPSKAYRLGPASSACGNGDFESGLNPSEWSGAYGSVLTNGNPDFANFTAGFSGGAINLGSARQTLVNSGTDPTVGIPTTAPTGSTKAVRIGNTVAGNGSELLAKSFVVSSANSTIRFWYAAVFQDPGHGITANPSFWVQVLDNSNTEISGAVNLGTNASGNPAKIVADKNNPFFKTQGSLVYKDWDCAEINLSSQIGKQVTVRFVVEDCTAGAHYGYAYVDDFCTNNCSGPSGSLSFNAAASDTCCKDDQAKICFNYDLPKSGSTTGSAVIQLQIFQNGNLTPLLTMASPTLTSGNSYCFSLKCSAIPGLNTALNYFDFVATAQFTLNSVSLAPKSVGSKPEGLKPGKNNDYLISCPSPKPPAGTFCCPDLKNQIKNPDFNLGNTAFTSQYTYEASLAANTVTPGEYGIGKESSVGTVCSQWKAKDGSCNSSGLFMVVNGRTGQSGKRKIWEQTVSGLNRDKYLTFCAKFKNLPACCFDVKPKIDVTFSIPGNDVLGELIDVDPANGCAWKEVKKYLSTGSNTSLTITIWLDETGVGDGNDLALDDFSLYEIPPVNITEVQFGLPPLQIIDLGGGFYSFTATSVKPMPTGGGECGSYWEVCQLDASDQCIASTKISNPSQWWSLPNYNTSINFPGYVGTSSLNPPILVTNPGKFEYKKKYRVTRGVFCTCLGWNQWSVDLNSTAANKVLVLDTQTKKVLQETAVPKK